MPDDHPPRSPLEDLAVLFADSPSPKAILDFRPSQPQLDRASELLRLSRTGYLDDETKSELDQFEFAEILMRLVKAHIRKNQNTTNATQ